MPRKLWGGAGDASQGMSTIQRAERGEHISRLMKARILDGLSRHLGRQVTKDEIDEFKNASCSDDS